MNKPLAFTDHKDGQFYNYCRINEDGTVSPIESGCSRTYATERFYEGMLHSKLSLCVVNASNGRIVLRCS